MCINQLFNIRICHYNVRIQTSLTSYTCDIQYIEKHLYYLYKNTASYTIHCPSVTTVDCMVEVPSVLLCSICIAVETFLKVKRNSLVLFLSNKNCMPSYSIFGVTVCTGNLKVAYTLTVM